ncbi:MAG: hypothetical protein KDD25_01775 [Bdellovibrionales bacterium]|nr:hypothetical protein [Bdellovibrionales bacterium]
MKSLGFAFIMAIALLGSACGKKDSGSSKSKKAVPPSQNCLNYNTNDPRCYNYGQYGNNYRNYPYDQYGWNTPYSNYGCMYYGWGWNTIYHSQYGAPFCYNGQFPTQNACDLRRGSSCPGGGRCRPVRYGSFMGYCS